ncbi:HAD family phosphatase [Raineyella sp. LH-20]|uniref:HAD family hydrolase n=1 Tax=Raineyella sp. LH-20 TaxID=3081204 RepID=UPI002952CFB5|nr:HAD family phosphatase [Raineyella sp. LH-20]WOP17534.1 HAD family phosphatase [Raineyella sp. LH-20]
MLVLFDFGEVLGLPQTPRDRVRMAAVAGVELEAFNHRYWAKRQAYDKGDLTAGEYWHAIAGRGLAEETIEELAQRDIDSWLHLSEAVVALHADLVERGIPTALFSNAPVSIADAIDDLPELSTMQARLYSCRIHLAKPDPAAYRAACEELDVAPESVIMIDDRPVNCEGARSTGMQAVRFRNPEQLRADLEPLLVG